MAESDLHLAVSLLLSLTATVLMLILTLRSGHRHDDAHLAVMVSLVVANIGLSLSVLAVMFEDVAAGATARGITRVALLLIAAIYAGAEWDRWRQR